MNKPVLVNSLLLWNMLRFYRKTIYPRWHVNRQNCSEKKHQSCMKPKTLVLCSASHKFNDHSNHDQQKKQHADRKDKRCWDDPQFHFNFFRTSVFETAGWLGTAALYFNYHLRHINSTINHDRAKSSCIFSNIVRAMPKRPAEDKNISEIPYLVLPTGSICNVNNKESSECDILENIKSFTGQYVAAIENSFGVKNINKNDKKAFRYFQNAARHGSVSAFYNLGLCYHLGKGTRVNLNMAAFCYKKAAAKGHGLASFNLATFFYRGIGGLPVDRTIAKELLAEAAERDVPEAQLYFGILFLEEKKWHDAVRIFSDLVKKDVPDAHYYLGLCYESGLGIEKNEKLATELFKKSAAHGNNRALVKLQNVKNSKKDSEMFPKTAEERNLHTSTSVPELGAISKESNQSIARIPVLSYLDLFTPFFSDKDNSDLKEFPFIEDKNTTKEHSTSFLSFKNIPIVMQIKT